jgi:hypothetical protein
LKKGISFAYLLVYVLFNQEVAGLASETVGATAGLSVEVYSGPPQSRVGARGEAPIGAIDHLDFRNLVTFGDNTRRI